MKRNIVVAMLVVALAFMILPTQALAVAPPKRTIDYYTYMVGYQSKYYDIPIFVLYDPPGAGSYANFTKTTSNTVGFHFEMLYDPIAVQATVESTFSSSWGYSTPKTQQLRSMVIVESVQCRWELWYTETPTTSFYTLKLTQWNPTYGQDAFYFDELPSDLWVQDMTGTNGTYQIPVGVPSGSESFREFTSTVSAYSQLGVGIKLDIAGVEYELKAQVVIDSGSGWNVHYTFENPYSYHMHFTINSNSPFSNNWNEDQTNLSEIGYWFNPGSFSP